MRKSKLKRYFAALALVLGMVLAPLSPLAQQYRALAHADSPIPIKAVLITMFSDEANQVLQTFGPWRNYLVPGLSPDFANLNCNSDNVCAVTTSMGYANAALSIDALQRDRRFDFRKTYFIVTGIAGGNPHKVTYGSAAWAHHLVDFGLQWEIDSREAPNWPTGYTGINTRNPHQKPPLDYKTEVFTLNPALVAKAFSLSKDVVLSDNPQAQQWRSHYPYAPANGRPQVTQCDVASADTWIAGTRLAERAQEWTKILTNGAGDYCMTAQEDNATYAALVRGRNQGLVDTSRVLVLRAASDYDRPYPGLSDQDNLLRYSEQGGTATAAHNLALTVKPVVNDLVQHWALWSGGIT